jgi:multisubunit Na+/H+ antiporter MnhG subunit
MVVDGLSLLFVMIISLVGTAVFIFAGGYLAGHPQLRWFYALLALFMFSMLGLVFLLGVAVHDMETGVTLRALAAICFMLLTAPVSAHLIGRAAYRSGIRLWDRTRVDELDD